MRKPLVTAAVMSAFLALGGPGARGSADDTQGWDVPECLGDELVAEWPSGEEVRVALAEMGWIWGADEDLLWYGGLPPEGGHYGPRATLIDSGATIVEDGTGCQVEGYGGPLWMIPDTWWVLSLRVDTADPAYGWPGNANSDWTMLAQVFSVLSVDGVTRFEVRRAMDAPSTSPREFRVPGGVIVVEAWEPMLDSTTVEVRFLSRSRPSPEALAAAAE